MKSRRKKLLKSLLKKPRQRYWFKFTSNHKSKEAKAWLKKVRNSICKNMDVQEFQKELYEESCLNER